jgi:FKBP-type peptidyl-prolyl cis-trans isomerase FkpA/FKBP-type peptidyl-prolyl cis-trans isomerase FklB
MPRTITLALAVLLVAGGARAADPALETDEQKTIYALGIAISRNLGGFNLTPAELDIVKAGITDGVLNKPARVDLNTYGPKLQALAKERATAVAATEKKASEEYLAKAAGEKGAKKTASGLIYTEVTPGKGDAPKATDRVKVHYEGKLVDGTVFDSSIKRGEPASFPLNGVIKCWTEGVQMMKVGGKAKLICPSDIAYGDAGSPPAIKPGATLVFDVELLDIEKAPAAKPK